VKILKDNQRRIKKEFNGINRVPAALIDYLNSKRDFK
jgi:hypothetical protein